MTKNSFIFSGEPIFIFPNVHSNRLDLSISLGKTASPVYFPTKNLRSGVSIICAGRDYLLCLWRGHISERKNGSMGLCAGQGKGLASTVLKKKKQLARLDTRSLSKQLTAIVTLRTDDTKRLSCNPRDFISTMGN